MYIQRPDLPQNSRSPPEMPITHSFSQNTRSINTFQHCPLVLHIFDYYLNFKSLVISTFAVCFKVTTAAKLSSRARGIEWRGRLRDRKCLFSRGAVSSGPSPRLPAFAELTLRLYEGAAWTYRFFSKCVLRTYCVTITYQGHWKQNNEKNRHLHRGGLWCVNGLDGATSTPMILHCLSSGFFFPTKLQTF